MTRPDLSRLSPEEKDALILALLERVAALEGWVSRTAYTGFVLNALEQTLHDRRPAKGWPYPPL